MENKSIVKESLTMADNRIIDDLGFNFEDNAEVTQESYNANNSGFSDLFQEKFTSFNPEAIISGGNNKIKGNPLILRVFLCRTALVRNNSYVFCVFRTPM